MALVLAVVTIVEGHAGPQERPVSFDADHHKPELVHLPVPKNLRIEPSCILHVRFFLENGTKKVYVLVYLKAPRVSLLA